MKRKIVAALVIGTLLLGGCGTAGRDTGGGEQEPRKVAGETLQLKDIDLTAKGITLSGYNHDMKLSPDGRMVVFSGYNFDQSKETPENKLVLGDLVTGGARTFVGVGEALAWLKDSKGIVYVNDSSFGILDINSGEKKAVENIRTYATLSPDGKSLAYTVRGPEVFPWVKPEGPQPEAGLWVYDLATGAKKRLTEDEDAWYPLWYPDGKRIFYFCDLGKKLGDGAGHLQGMASIPLDGGQKQVFPQKQGKFRAAEWIVPGKSLHILEGWDDGYSHSVLDLERGNYVNLGESMGGDSLQIAVDNKNGRLIKTVEGRMEVLDLEGKKLNEFNLAEQGEISLKPTVAPGGDRVAYVESRQGNGAGGATEGNPVKLVDMKGTVTSLAQDGINNLEILWAKDGQNIISLQSRQSDGQETITAIKVLPLK